MHLRIRELLHLAREDVEEIDFFLSTSSASLITALSGLEVDSWMI